MVWPPVTHLGIAISGLLQRLAKAKLESVPSLKPRPEHRYAAHCIASQKLLVIPEH